MSQSSVAKYLSPQAAPPDSLRVHHDSQQRERVLILNDTIRSVAQAGGVLERMGDDEGTLTSSVILNKLLEELEASIFEEVDDG